MLFGNKEKLKVGVIGVGVLGRFHTKLYRENPNVELVGVFDVSPAAAEKVGQEFGVKTFPSEAELAAQCDALTVAVPATNHYETAMPLIEMGKHLLLEKPLAATVPQARELLRAVVFEVAGVVVPVQKGLFVVFYDHARLRFIIISFYIIA